MVGFFFWTFVTLFILISLFMILLILIQKGRGGGLASAFGGAGGNTAFGSKTGDVLTWVTSVAFGVFLVIAVVLNRISDARQNPGKPVANANSAITTPTIPTTPAMPPAKPVIKPATAPSLKLDPLTPPTSNPAGPAIPATPATIPSTGIMPATPMVPATPTVPAMTQPAASAPATLPSK